MLLVHMQLFHSKSYTRVWTNLPYDIIDFTALSVLDVQYDWLILMTDLKVFCDDGSNGTVSVFGTIFLLLYGDQRCHCVVLQTLKACYSVPHLMCRRTERTFTTAAPSTAVALFVILTLNTKLQTYLLTYWHYD